MAEIDSYRPGGHYRGGGGGFNKRKRGREDDEINQQPYRNQHHRRDAPPGSRLRRGLLDIGEDDRRRPQDEAFNLARLASDNYEDEYVRETVTSVIMKLVVEQPFKIPFVAAVVLYAHQEKKEVAANVVTKAGEHLHEFLGNGQWREVKLMLRFLACLSRVYEEDGVLPIMDELFNCAVDLQTASQDDVLGIELVKIILLTIPYLLAFASDASLQDKVAEILEKTEVVASAQHPLESLVDPYPVTGEETERPMACASLISLLQRQLQDEAGKAWPLACIPRLFDPSLKATAANGDANGETNGDSSSSGLIQFPTITVTSPVNPGSKTLFPELYFSLYADQDIESVPSTANIASTLLRDATVDTINILNFNRNATARFLNQIDRFWADGTFVPPATAFDKLQALAERGQPTWKSEDVTIDAIFSQIFTLPAPEHRLVYYHSLITESCRLSPGAIAPSLGRAIRFLFRGVDVMDLELAYRYMDWFAHHLSNFEFRWKWAEWIPETSLPDLHPKKAFINGAIDKEIRLSFAKRIRETLPEDFRPLVPTSKEKDIPDFKFADEQTPFAKEGREVLSLLKRKAPEEDIQKVLDSVHDQARDIGIEDPLVSSTDIYMTAILSIGSKSLSHVLSTIDRCKERLLAIGPQSEEARRQIINSVFEFWADHPGTAVNIVDKLLNYTVVGPINVIEWALRDNMDRGRGLARTQIYELISITMFKVTNRVRQLLAHRNNVEVAFHERQQVDGLLPRERQATSDLFGAIEDAVRGVAEGSNDEMIERFDGGEDEEGVIKAWGERWTKVWRRKKIVEEAIANEAMTKVLEEPPAAPVQEDVMVEGAEEDMDRVE